MAETCIVCLGDLRTSVPVDPEPPPSTSAPAESATDDASKGSDAKQCTRASSKSIESDEEAIAHLLPCGHNLHNSCLKPWVERANSCPICRATFNMVELFELLGGPVVDSYAVQDKVQQAELDPTMVIEDELFAVEAWEPCLLCGLADDGHGVMYCDGCDKAVHVFCAGHDDAPEVWYCETCLEDLENDLELPGIASAMRGRTRRRPAARSRRPRRHNDALWARVWQEVSQRLDLDLDFPFDDDLGDQRTEEQRREFARWQRRFEVASQQGAANRLRDIANARLQQNNAVARPAPESQEELRAWNAFDKARESQDAPPSIRRRKRKATASPAPSSELEQVEQPPQKRPRLRRPHFAADQPVAQASTSAPANIEDRPTFLSSLLREVESKPISASSPGASENHTGHQSPADSSPDASSSGSITPRGLSVSPALRPQRPSSPPLSSTIVPLSSPLAATFSPFSPADITPRRDRTTLLQHRGRKRSSSPHNAEELPPEPRASSSSPSRGLSYSAKEEIQRMVKLALGSRYRDKEITKDQYTDINKSVSRKLYELVATADALTDQSEREKWQSIAEDEVKKAVAALAALAVSDE